LITALVATFTGGCCPGPFCEGGPGMCSRLEGEYVLETDDQTGDCGNIPVETSLIVSDRRPGYALEAAWLRGCVLQAAKLGSCEYGAQCEALVGGAVQPLALRVRRNSSGFYGPAEITTKAGKCTLDVSTSPR
jgi:hypothetical protein